MSTLYQVLGLIGAIAIIFILYRFIKAQPQALSRENLNKSFYTMGLLGLGLIGFVTLLIFIVNHS